MTPRLHRPRSALLAAVVAAAAVLAGCAPSTTSSSNSTSKFKGDQRQAAQTIEDLEAAANDGNETKICNELLSRALSGRLAAHGASCPVATKAAVKDADSVGMTVDQVRINGDRATARVTLDRGNKDRVVNMQLVREGGRWKIAEL
jgi:ABC-type oligopeptide transport system substrate-binding subunit